MNYLELRRFIDVIHPDGELFEVRVIDGKKTFSGYFTDSQLAYESLRQYENANIYIIFNKIKDACYSRLQRDTITYSPKSTTSDVDIEKRTWVLIDIDPKRPSDCNSTDEELALAKLVMERVYVYLKKCGFSEPVFGMSGNGYHMLYRVDMPNNPQTLEVVKGFLQALSMMFFTDRVEIDKSVSNAARITKLLGTFSRKGTSKDVDRPQRLSQLLHVPETIKTTHVSLFERVAAEVPKVEKPSYSNNYGRDRFDIDAFISKHGIRVHRESNNGSARKIVLDECPFDSNHKAPDSAIFVGADGAIGFKCFHNSCSGHTWRDLRNLFEPDRARDYRDDTRTTKPILKRPDSLPLEEADNDDIGPKFFQLHEIKNLDRSQIVSLPTKFNRLDNAIIGLNKGEVSLVSGSNSSGKSTFINQLCLNILDEGFKASIFSGELTSSRMKNWIHLQAAGRQYTMQSKFSENSFYVKPSIGDKIDAWLKNKLYIYNNDYGNRFDTLMADLKWLVTEKGVDLVVLDNLMALDILMLDGDRNQQQARMIIEITNFAKKFNVHVIIIAHPRKVMSFLRKNDISGSGDLSNAVDNVFIVHRVNNDFIKSAGEFFGSEVAAGYFTFHNVIEVCKNRDLGIQDYLVGLYFEIESKRFLNERFDNVMYGWTELLNEQTDIEYPSMPSIDSFVKPEIKPNTSFYDEAPALSIKPKLDIAYAAEDLEDNDLDSEYPF